MSSGNDYSITVTDGSGCTGATTATVTNTTVPTPSILGNTVIYPGGSTLLSTGAFATYLGSNGSTIQSTTAIGAGNYVVTVSDVNGCMGSASATVTELPVFTAGSI